MAYLISSGSAGSDTSWETLQRLVERQATSSHSTSLFMAVAEAILRVDKALSLPEWLLSLIQVRESDP